MTDNHRLRDEYGAPQGLGRVNLGEGESSREMTKCWHLFVVVLVGVVASFAWAVGKPRKDGDGQAEQPKSRVEVDMYRGPEGLLVVEVWEGKPLPPGRSQGDPPPASGPTGWTGVKRCRDIWIEPPDGTKVSGTIVPPTGGWTGRTVKGSKGSGFKFYAGSSGGDISTDPNNPTRFYVTPNPEAGSSHLWSIAVTLDGGPDPPRKPWNDDPNVGLIRRGDDQNPLPGPCIWINGPPAERNIVPGTAEEVGFSAPLPGREITALIYEPGPGLSEFYPEYLIDLMESGVIVSDGSITARTSGPTLSAEGVGTVLLEAPGVSPGEVYYLVICVNDEEDGFFPSPIDLHRITRINIR